MATFQNLRMFINERLTAAAVEICVAVEKTITQYEDEIDRQRKLLDVVLSPELKLHRLDLGEPHDAILVDQVPAEQQQHSAQELSSLDHNPCSGVYQEDQSPHKKRSSSGPVTLGVPEKTSDTKDAGTFAPTCDSSDHDHRDQTLSNPIQALVEEKGGDPPLLGPPASNQMEAEPSGNDRGEAQSSDSQPVFSDGALSENGGNGDSDGDGDWEESGGPKSVSKAPKSKKTLAGNRPKESRNTSCCRVCGKRYSNDTWLLRHAKTHAKDKECICSVCGQQQESKLCLKQHLKIHRRKSYCDICGKDVGRYLQQHMRIHTGEKPFECNICLKTFIQQGALQCHMRTHTGEKPYVCDACGRGFADYASMLRHKTVHMSERPHSCTQCGKGYKSALHLREHMKIHIGEKRYLCHICSKAFIHLSTLTCHLRTHSKEKPYTCSECAKCFKDSGTLSRHMKIHTGSKPHSCSECGISFCAKNKLDLHMRTHTGEKPYVCSICKKEFGRMYYLTLHRRTHTGEKPYECKICEKRFTQGISLKTHLNTHLKETTQTSKGSQEQ